MKALAFLLILSLSTDAIGHLTDTRVASFPITIEDTQLHTVSLPDNQGSCVFSFTTRDAPIQTQAPHPVVTESTSSSSDVNMDELLASLRGLCIQTKIDYWDYEICFGQSVKQFHGDDIYYLGNQGLREGNQQVYRDGAVCEVTSKPRVVQTIFVCHEHSNRPELIKFDEVTTCVYQAKVAYNAVCSDPNFEVVENVLPSQSVTSSVPNIVSDGTEDWYLEVSRGEDGSITCSVYTLELKAAGSSLTFHQWTLSLVVPNEKQLKYLICRHPGRLPCGMNEVGALDPGISQANTVGITSLPGFDGKLGYLKVMTT